MLECLLTQYIDKKFVVYVSIGDSFIVRFHQKWLGEEDYYSSDELKFYNEKIFKFEKIDDEITIHSNVSKK